MQSVLKSHIQKSIGTCGGARVRAGAARQSCVSCGVRWLGEEKAGSGKEQKADCRETWGENSEPGFEMEPRVRRKLFLDIMR